MLNTPTTGYSNYYEQARFRLTWNIMRGLIVALALMCILFLSFEPQFFIHYASGFVLCSIGTLYLYFKRDYKLVAVYVSLLGFLLVCSSFYFVPRAIHYIEPFWLFIISMYAYFTLGNNWGRVYMTASVLVVSLYFVFGLNTSLTAFKEMSLAASITMAVEFLICCLVLAYIVHQFITTNSHAEEKYRSANLALLDEKKNVESQNLEKTVLLQEIHHRVKNNLQVITSLLRIQSNNIVSQEGRENFQDAINRIMTMALIHQKMYEKDNLSEIDLRDYFDSLVTDLVMSNSPDIEITLDVNIEVEKVGAKSIVPLALIITELVTNSIKHAFANQNNGQIGLRIAPAECQNKFNMEYYDNGKWKHQGREDSFGLQLVDTFTEQLEGSYELNLNEGKSLYRFTLQRIDAL